MKTKTNQSKQNELELKLTEIVFEDEIFRVKSTKNEVTPKAIGEPKILKRYMNVDSVTPYPYHRTIYSNARFEISLEKDIESICPSSANAYSLGERGEIFSNINLNNEEYAVQFYII